MITLDYSNVLPFIGGEEAVKRMEPQVKAAHDMLHKKNGPVTTSSAGSICLQLMTRKSSQGSVRLLPRSEEIPTCS